MELRNNNPNIVKVLLYGAGYNGRQFLSALRSSKYGSRAIEVIGFVDKNTSLHGECVLGVKVFPPEHIAHLEFDLIIITARIQYDINKKLVDELGIPTNKIDNYTAIKLLKNMDNFLICQIPQNPLVIPFLVVCIGQACTLRCKDCANFSPFAPKEHSVYPVTSILDNLHIITANSSIDLLHIQGGESFVYPYLDDILRFVIESANIRNCQIATNGTLLPKTDLNLLKSEKITVRVSNYPSVKNIAEKLRKFLLDNGINHRIHDFVSFTGEWNDIGGINLPCEQDDDAVQKRFDLCAKNRCFTLENSKISRCSRGVIAEAVQGFASKAGDYLIVNDSPDFKERLIEYVTFPKFMEACRYCNGYANSKLIEPAVQLPH